MKFFLEKRTSASENPTLAEAAKIKTKTEEIWN